MTRICSINGCEKIHSSRGYCVTHYKKLWTTGAFGNEKECSVTECLNKSSVKGYCPKHYTWARQNGLIDSSKKCTVEGCDKNHSARGYCKSHYSKAIRSGKFSDYRKCEVNDCDKPHASNGYCERHSVVYRRYKIDPSEYENIYKLQDGSCEICKKKTDIDSYQNDRLFVDHNHKTGDVRGLICVSCNSIIGHADDDINVLLSCVKYLEKYNNGYKTFTDLQQ